MRIFMSGTFLYRSALALAALALFAGCAELEPPPTVPAAVVPPPLPYAWNGDGVPGAPKIVVHIGKQRAYFFKGNALVGETTVSTGKPGFSTPPGQYRVAWKNEDHISTRFGDYLDDYGNVVKSNAIRARIEADRTRFDGARMPYASFSKAATRCIKAVPPYAASGCIRLPNGIAEIFFNAAPMELGCREGINPRLSAITSLPRGPPAVASRARARADAHRLPRIWPAVDHARYPDFNNPVSPPPSGMREQPAKQRSICLGRVGQSRHDSFRHDQDMHRGLRVYIMKSQRLFIFPNDLRRNLAPDDFLENGHATLCALSRR